MKLTCRGCELYNGDRGPKEARPAGLCYFAPPVAFPVGAQEGIAGTAPRVIFASQRPHVLADDFACSKWRGLDL